jgi:hypothetical protein
MKKLILEIELIPASCFFSNVRSEVSKRQWDLIRKKVYSEAYHICQICGGKGPKHPVEAHETWNFDDDSLTQILTGMIALCPMCHATKHYGLARIQGREASILKHFIKINNIDKAAATTYIDSVFNIWQKRSQKKWKLDISVLKNYGIKVNELSPTK